MGLGSSKESTENEKIENIKKIFDKNDSTSDILDSLNITEFKPDYNTPIKMPLPILGGNRNNLKLNSSTSRYAKYDIFKLINELEQNYQNGGSNGKENNDLTVNNNNDESLSSEQAMEHIKKIILKELKGLQGLKGIEQTGAGCGCDAVKKNNIHKSIANLNQQGGLGSEDDEDSDDSSSSTSSSSDSDEYGKQGPKSKKISVKSKKPKSKKPKSKKLESSSSNLFIDPSESGKSTTLSSNIWKS